MKGTWIISLVIAVVLSGCNNDTLLENRDKNREPADNKTNALIYNENGIRFEVPKAWEDNFSDVVATNGTGELKYTTIEFSYSADEISVPVMMISKFSSTQWEMLTSQDKNAAAGLIGKSSNGKNYYHVYFAELDYFSDTAQREQFEAVKREARQLKAEIAITE